MSRIKHIQGIFGQTFSALPVVKRHRDGRQQRPCLDPTPMGHTVQSGTSCQGKGHSPPVAPKEQKANGQQYAIPAVIHFQTFCHKHRAARTQKPSASTFHAPHGKERHQQLKKHILAGKLPPSRHKQWKSETGMGPRKSLQTDPTAKRAFSGWTCGQTPLPKEIKTAETTICRSTAAKTPRETGKAPHGPPTWCTTR